jgi:uncharacterized membrane protein
MKPMKKSAAMTALLFLIVPLFLLVSQWDGLTPTLRAGAIAVLLLATIFIYRFHILLAAAERRQRDEDE